MRDSLPTVSSDAYVIEGEVARGGLGRVLKARHCAMARIVAVKELLPGVEAEASFVQEALVTGRLEHPAIVPVYEAGRWPSGEPFYAMKLVSGRSLLSVIQSSPAYEARVALLPNVIAVAEAIAYAHSKRVIHRDLKPANIIVGSFGETVVIDWGVAKDLDAPPLDQEIVLARGGDEDSKLSDVVGTPAYMAPEQAKGEPVDERTDVYALGAVLYTVLAGVPPYARVSSTDSRAATRQDAPQRPLAVTEVLAEVVLRPPPSLEIREPRVPKELLTIVHKAMARAPEDRYPTAKELAEDLKRFQTGKLVSAHHYSWWELTRRFLHKNRAMVAVVTAAVLTLVIGGAVSIARVIQARRIAERRAQELILLQARALTDTDPTSALAWLKQYPIDGPSWDEARRTASIAVGRGVARDLLRGHKGTVRAVTFSPDGKTLASAGVDGTIRLWDLAHHTAPRILVGHDGIVTSVAFSPDGKTLASTGFDARVLLWDVATGVARPIGDYDHGVRAVAFSRDGRTLVASGFDYRLTIWSVAGEKLRVLEGHVDSPFTVGFSPDGQTLFSAANDDTVRLWDLTTGQARVLPTKSTAAYSPDGRTVAAGFDGEVRFFDVASGTTRSVRVPGFVRPRAFSPDGSVLVATSFDTVRLVNVANGRVSTFTGHESDVYDAAFSPDGRVLASSGMDGTIRLWDLPAAEGRALHGFDATADRVAFAPDGKTLAAQGADGRIAVWDLEKDSKPRFLDGPGGAKKLFYTAGGRVIITAGADHVVRAFDAATGEGRAIASTAGLPRLLAVAADQPWLVVADGFDALRVVSYADGSVGCRLAGRNIVVAAFAPGGGALYYGNGGEVRRLDLGSCAETRVVEHEGGWVMDLAVSARWLGYATKYGRIGVVDLTTGSARVLADDAYETKSVALSPDGKLMAAGSDLKILMWDPARGARVRELSGHESPIEGVAFTADGSRLVSWSPAEVRVWHASADGDRVYRAREARIKATDLSPDGKTIAIANADGTVRVWAAVTDGGLPTDAAALRAWLDTTTSVRLDDRDRVATPLP